MTIMALNPDHLYDVVAINAASMSTQLAGLPFSGPIGAHPRRARSTASGSRSRPTASSRRPSSTWSSPAASSTDGDVAIMMVEAEATDRTDLARSPAAPRRRPRRSSPQGLEAAKPFIQALCEAQQRLADAGRQADRASSRSSSTTRTTSSRPSTAAVAEPLAAALTIAGKQEREAELDRVKALAVEAVAAQVRGPREGDRRGATAR